MNFNQSPIVEFKRERDFGKIFNDSFRFMKVNFKSLAPVLIFLAGPVYMIAGGYQGYVQATGADLDASVYLRNGLSGLMDFYGEILMKDIPFRLLLVLASVFGMAAVSRYVISYKEIRQNNAIRVSDIMPTFFADLWRVFSGAIVVLLLTALIVALLVFIAKISLGLFFLVGFFLAIGFLLVGPQLSFAVTAGYYLSVRDGVFFVTGFRKAWRYMIKSNNFWWTWLIIVVSGLIVGISAAMFGLPLGIFTIITKSMTRGAMEDPSSVVVLVNIVLGIIALSGSLLLSPLSYLFAIIGYYSFEETIEGGGLKDRINEINLDA